MSAKCPNCNHYETEVGMCKVEQCVCNCDAERADVQCDDLRAQLAASRAVEARLLKLLEDAVGQGLCVECGPTANVDEDGCCLSCGATATGSWLDAFRKMLNEELTKAKP